MKNDRLNGSCWLSVVGCRRKGLPSFFLPTLAFAIALTLLLAPPLAAQWEMDRRLTFNDSASYMADNNARCLAAGPGGALHLVWVDKRDGNYEIYYKRSSDQGTSWSQDLRLTANPGWSEKPSITVSDTLVHVVWTDDRDGNYEIYYKRSTDSGLTWSQDTRLTNDTSRSSLPSVSSSDSSVHLVWTDWRGGAMNIYYRGSRDGGVTWSSERLLPDSGHAGTSPAIASGGDFVHVAWWWPIGVCYKRSTDGGASWSRDTILDGFRSQYPSIMTDGPFVHITYEADRDSDGVNCNASYRRASNYGSTWSNRVPIDSFQRTSSSATIAADGPTIHVIWKDHEGPSHGAIWYKRSTDRGIRWEGDVRLTSRGGTPFVAVTGTAVHVVWVDGRDGNSEIYYKRNPTGNSGTETAEERGQRLEVRFKPKPNPFTFFTLVPGQEKETFELYDIAGRKVGMYRGDRIGANLPAGVYFLRTTGKTTTPVRIVKVR